MVAPYVVQLAKKKEKDKQAALWEKIMQILIEFHGADKNRAGSSGDQGLVVLQWI